MLKFATSMWSSEERKLSILRSLAPPPEIHSFDTSSLLFISYECRLCRSSVIRGESPFLMADDKSNPPVPPSDSFIPSASSILPPHASLIAAVTLSPPLTNVLTRAGLPFDTIQRLLLSAPISRRATVSSVLYHCIKA